MTLRQLYYAVKPIIPRSLQIALRRQITFWKLKSVGDVWPIDSSAGKVPQGWKGWPDKKKFALVLTHDVDTLRGHDRSLDLMAIEKKLGFRSSFNFVPEGYRVPTEVRQTLTENGFDVGVHGLLHDEKLFASRRTFEKRAPRINDYLKAWKAVGFHSPAMFHNLDWIAELDIEYDSSTFDTDPFEPQPDGVKTIFPFAVYRKSVVPAVSGPSSLPASQPGSFYVELPYTLPQDHCLFVILREKNISIWKEKLDWIVEKGGMVLLNAHPDYMNLNGSKCRLEEYPIKYYTAFLEHVKTKYEGEYWHALPREVARFWQEWTLSSKQRVSRTWDGPSGEHRYAPG